MLKKVMRAMLRPRQALMFAKGKLSVISLNSKKNISLGQGVSLRGKAIFDIKKGCSLYVGNNVTLNSENKGYHLNMHSPVKLMADRDGAIIKIGENTRIHGTCIHAYESITIGNNCLIAANCQIFDGSGHDLSFPNVENRINTGGGSKPVIIGDNVWIGANSIILPGVTIGYGSVVAANSVVTKNIPDMTIVGGNPAKVVRTFE